MRAQKRRGGGERKNAENTEDATENARVHIAEGIFCEIRKRLRSLLSANEEAAFEIW